METAGAAAASSSDDTCFPLETLPSPVMDDINDELADEIGGEMLKLSLEKWLVEISDPRFGQGLEKSRVRVWP